jgi:hypothetical protein
MFGNRARIWFSLFVLAVFCVGLSFGVILGRRMVGPGMRGFANFGPPGPGAGRRGAPPGVLLDRLDRELSLTGDQRARIAEVLEASRNRLDRLQQETHNRLESEQRSLREDIRKELTPDQQSRFDRWIAATRPAGSGRRGRGERPPGLLP